MASLRNISSNEIIVLNTYHQFGRALQNDTCMDDNDVSRKHATISWEESAWKLTDHSKNGTIVDSRFVCRASKELRIGSKIQFGRSNITSWEVLDLNPPCSFLKSRSTKNGFIELSTMLIWPNEESPEISFYQTANLVWNADFGDDIVELKNGEILVLGSEEWEFVENEPLDSTSDTNDISNYACFVFDVSADEETISVKIIINELKLDLGERVYNHVLYRLVQQRYLDEKQGCATQKQGWVMMDQITDYLSKELLLEVDAYYLNVQIHRLRKKLMELPPYGYLFSNVIERKNGELRFNHPYFKIVKEESTNAQSVKKAEISQLG